MDNHYKGLIWTNHALQRLKERGVSQGDAWATWNHPDQSRPGSGSKSGAWVYYRTWGNQKIEVVAKKNEKGEWIVISVWADCVNNYLPKEKISFWKSLAKILFG